MPFVGVRVGMPGALGRAGGGGPLAPYVGPASTGGVMQVEGARVGQNQVMSRCREVAWDNLHDIQLMFGAWYIGPSTGYTETNVGSTLAVTASIEFGDGTIQQVTFSGIAQGSCADGGTITSDLVTLSKTIPRGSVYWIRNWQNMPSGLVAQSNADNANGEGGTGGATTPDLTLGGAVSTSAGASFRRPCAVLSTTTYPTFGVIGDSRVEGVGSTGRNNGWSGEILSWLSNNYGWVAAFRQGAALSDYNTNAVKSVPILAKASHILLELGINDENNTTLAGVKTRQAAVWAMFPGKKFVATTHGPFTSSTQPIVALTSVSTTATAQVATTANMTNGATLTIAGAAQPEYNGTYVISITDGTHFTYTFAGSATPTATGTITWSDRWATVINQTVVSVAQNTVRTGANDWRRSGAENTIDGYFEIADAQESGRNSGFWKAGGITSDGLHGGYAEVYASSPVLILTPRDLTAPVLTSPLVTGFTDTTAALSVTTDDATGTLYYVITTSATPPSKAQVKAGQNDGGTAAAASGNQAIASTGTKTANATGLTGSTAYYAYFMHEDSVGNQSSVAATATFTTSATTFFIAQTDHAEDNTSLSTYTWSSKAFAIGTAAAGRLVVVGITARVGGTTATPNSVTIGGVAATKVDEARNTGGGTLTTTSVWQALVPSGTTATVSAVFSAAMSRAGCTVYTVIGSNGVAPSGANTANNAGAGATASATITVPTAGGAIIFGAMIATGAPTITPTNYTTDLAVTNVGSTVYYSAGHNNSAGSRTYTMTWAGTVAGSTGVFSAWSP